MKRWVPATLLLFAFLLFANSFSNQLLKFDDWWIVHHERMGEWLTPSGIGETLFDLSKETRMKHGAEYLPVRDFSAAIQSQLFGANPFGYHFVQTLLYGLSSVLLFYLLLQLGLSTGIAWLGSALFLAHPLHVESVTWLSGHKDILSLLFLFAHLLAYARGRWLLSLGFLLLGIFSKYNIMFVPLLLPLLDRSLGRDVLWKRWVLFLLPTLLGIALASVVGLVVSYGHLYLGNDAMPILTNLPVTFQIALTQMVMPAHLQLFYPYETALSWLDPRLWRGLAYGAFLIALFAWGWKNRSPIVFALGFIPIGLAPMFRAPEMHYLADRYLLVSSIGVVVLMVIGISKLRRRYLQWGLAGALIVAFSCLTVFQNRVWKDDLALWSHAASGVKPVHQMVWKGLAIAAQDQGEWRTSEHAYQKLLPMISKKDEKRGEHLTNLGFVQIQSGRMEKAEQSLRKAIALDPKSFQAEMNLGTALAMSGKRPAAAKHYKKAHHLDPSNVDVLFNLARLALEMGEVSHARALLRELEMRAESDPRLSILKQARDQ